MAERSTSRTDEHILPDFQNFEHGVVNSDAVYVPHSKQSSRGRRGRGKSSGDYRHRHQQDDRLECDPSKQSGARGKHTGGRGQCNQYYGRHNAHSTAYGNRNIPEYDASSFGDIYCYSECNVADRNPSYGTAADSYNGVHRAHIEEAELRASSSYVRQHGGNSRASRQSRDDHRYDERSHKHDVDLQHSHRGRRRVYSRGRGSRGVSNYYVDDKVSTTRDSSLRNGSISGTVTGVESSNEANLHDVTEFTDRKKFGSEAQYSRQLKSNSHKLPVRDDKYVSDRSPALSLDSNCISDDLRFRDLCISAEVKNLPLGANSQAIVNTKIKSSDPEFESQRGVTFNLLYFMHVCVTLYTSQKLDTVYRF